MWLYPSFRKQYYTVKWHNVLQAAHTVHADEILSEMVAHDTALSLIFHFMSVIIGMRMRRRGEDIDCNQLELEC